MTDKLKPCSFCGGEVKVHGPENWKPTFYDPDSGGDPYGFYCECGMRFDTDSYDYEEAVKKFNTRKPMDRIVEQLEEQKAKHERLVDYEAKLGTFVEKMQHKKAVEVLERAIAIVKGVQNE